MCPHPVNPVPTVNWVFEYQPLAKKAESILPVDEKGPQDRGRLIVCVIHIFLLLLLSKGFSWESSNAY